MWSNRSYNCYKQWSRLIEFLAPRRITDYMSMGQMMEMIRVFHLHNNEDRGQALKILSNTVAERRQLELELDVDNVLDFITLYWDYLPWISMPIESNEPRNMNE